jgi:hypothetical protein
VVGLDHEAILQFEMNRVVSEIAFSLVFFMGQHAAGYKATVADTQLRKPDSHFLR